MLSAQDLRSRLEALRDSLSNWFASIEALRNSTAVPTSDLFNSATSLRSDFDFLRQELAEMAKECALSLEVDPLQVQTLDGLGELLEVVVASAEEQRRRVTAALECLGEVKRLKLRDFPDLPSLAELRSNAVALEQRILELTDRQLIEQLSSGTHPYARLHKLALATDLSDAEWDALRNELDKELDVDLVRAAARQKLELRTLERTDERVQVKTESSSPAKEAESIASENDTSASQVSPSMVQPSSQTAEANPFGSALQVPPEAQVLADVSTENPVAQIRRGMSASTIAGIRELFSKREPPPVYEPSTFRSARDPQDYRRNPLTARQESDLSSGRHGVAIICGSQIAGLDDLKDFMSSPSTSYRLSLVDDVTDRESFRRKLTHAVENRAGDTVTIFLVPHNCPWTPPWLNVSQERTSQLKSQQSFARVVFSADPQAILRLLEDNYDPIGRGNMEGILTLTLAHWADATVRQWLDDCRVVASPDQRAKLTELTGNWPCVLYKFYSRFRAHNGNLRRATDDLTHELSDPPTAVKYLEGFGITQAPAIRALDILRQHPGFEDTKDLAELAEIDEAQFLRYLRWSEILGYIKSDSRSGMMLDPIISRLLGAWTIL